jgi:hypothetical protein
MIFKNKEKLESPVQKNAIFKNFLLLLFMHKYSIFENYNYPDGRP